MTELQTPPGAPDPDPLGDSRWPRSRQWQVSLAAAVVALVIVVGAGVAHRLFGGEAAPAARSNAPPGTFRATAQQLKTFTVESVHTHAFFSEEATEGKIAVDSDHATSVVSPYSGRVTRVIAGLGDAVKAGQALATVEASEFVQAQNDLKVAAAQAKLARTNENRKHALYEAKGGSLQDWQQSQADLAAAETALYAARNRLQILGRSESDIAKLENADIIEPSATIVAPIAGVVVDRQIGPGQFLQAGGSPVFTVADLSSVWLLAHVRESDAGLVKPGQTVVVRVLAYPERAFKARVTNVAAVVDPTTHRVAVRAVIENHDGALKPEMFASFHILTSAATEAPAVPESAVVYEGDAAHVWVLTGDLLSYRAIRVGRTRDGLVEVREGLEAGEQVVTKGGLFIDQAAVPASS